MNAVHAGAVTLLLLATGCEALDKPEFQFEQTPRDGVSTLTLKSNLRNSYFKAPSHPERFCAEPVPDAAESLAEGVSIGAGLPSGTSDSAGESLSAAGVALGGRNPEVLITRELMFRACELSLNHGTSLEDSLKIYEMFLATVRDIAKTNAAAAGGSAAIAGPAATATIGGAGDSGSDNGNGSSSNGSSSNGSSSNGSSNSQ